MNSEDDGCGSACIARRSTSARTLGDDPGCHPFTTKEDHPWPSASSVSAASAHPAKAAETPAQWAAFGRKFRAEMAEPDASRSLDLLAALSHQGAFSIGCYCEDESHCHRSFLRELLKARGAEIVD